MACLLEAAGGGDLALLGSILDAGANLETRDSEGDTALTIAATRGHATAVRLLLEKGSDVNAQCNAGNSALHSAAMKGNLAVAQVLLAGGASKDARNKRGNTALRVAVSAGNEEVLLALLKAGADPNIAGNDGTTPLMAAAYSDCIVAVDALLEAGVDSKFVNGDGQTALMFAVNRGALKSTAKLLQAGSSVGDLGAQLLALAICAPQNSDLIALKLIEEGGVLSGLFEGATPLLLAISSNRLSIAEALLASGADPNQVSGVETEEVTPLIAAVMSGGSQCVESLLKYGADPNQAVGEVTPMIGAMVRDHYEIQRLLLASGAVFTRGSLVLLRPDDEGGAEISGGLASLVAQQFRDDRVGMPSALPSIFQEQLPPFLNLAMQCLENNAVEIARVVISNHVGVPRRRDEEIRAKSICVEEIAKILVRGTDLYEDDHGVMATAEFILSRIRYRRLTELGRQSGAVTLSCPRDGLGYEDACRNELLAHGYSVRKTPPTGDQGADLLANKGGITYAIQCKNYAGSVGNSAVQEAISAKQFYGTDNAVVVSDGKFTVSARELAARARVVLRRKASVRNIDVICASIA